MRLGKSSRPIDDSRSDSKLISQYLYHFEQYQTSQDYYKERIDKIRSESNNLLFGEYGLIKQSVKEYFQKYPERKRISISQQQVSKAREAKMKRDDACKWIEDLVFEDNGTGNSLNIDSTPFKPRHL